MKKVLLVVGENTLAVMLDSESYEKWLKKRRSTYIIYCLQYYINGTEEGFKNATLWIYVTTVLKCENPYFWFGVINSCMYLPSLLFNPFISALADKYRRPKLFVIISNFVAIFANLMYAIPYSPYYAAIGMFLFGFKYTLRPVMIGEIVRSYPVKELNQKLPAFPSLRNFGTVSAVLFLLPFQKIYFDIFGMPVRYGNIVGILGSILYAFVQVLAIFFVYDLSNEYDLKKEEQQDTEQLLDGSKKETKNLKGFHVLRKIYSNPDVVLT